MKKAWLESYPEGVPAEIDLTEFNSVVDVFDKSVREFADLPAFNNFGVTMSYAQLDDNVARFADYLQNVAQLNKGDRVAIMMPNLLQYPVAIFGCLRAGLTVVNTNPLYTARELKHQLTDSEAKAVVIVENFAHVLQEVLPETSVKTVITTQLGDLLGFPKSLLINFVVKRIKKMVPAFSLPAAVPFRQALALGAGKGLISPEIGPDNVAFLQYTGGTTGVAKGAALTHGNMVANMQQASAWIRSGVETGKEIIVTALPLYHIFSLTANCMTFMKIGGLNVLITNPRDMPAFVKTLGQFKFTVITGVNTLFNGLLNAPGFADLDFSRFKLCLGGGMAVQRAVAEKWKQVTSQPILEAYGLTETSPAVCINPVDLHEYNASIGLPVPSTECQVCDDEGRFLEPGQVGELCVRGPQVMQGYWNRPEETAKVMLDGGWLRTGDVAQMDEKGFFRIVDRKKDMILVSGFNVYPNEIEDIVASHPGVLEVGAIGVPDEKSGEAVKVIIVRKDASLDEEELRRFCKGQLTGYKVPRYVHFTDELPKSNVGKILRRELREQYGAQA